MSEEIIKKNPAYRNGIKDENTKSKDIADSLGFFKKAKDFWDIVSDKENPSKMSLIEWLRGSGKSSFINILLKVIQEDKKDWFLPVLFTPRYLEPDKFYQSFFEQFSSVLLQYRYDDELLTNTQDIIEVLWWVHDSMKSITGLLSFFFKKQKKSPSELIENFVQVITKTYSNQTIVIVVDEIDRLWNEELHHFAKLLDIIKQIAERCNNVYVLCAWSQQYLEQQIVAGQRDDDKKAITYQEYCNRFFDEVIRFSSQDGEFVKWVKTMFNIELNESQFKNMINHCQENRITFVMRNAKRILSSLKKTLETWDSYITIKDFYDDNKKLNRLEEIIKNFDYIEYLYWMIFYRYKWNLLDVIYDTLNPKWENKNRWIQTNTEKRTKENDKRWELINQYTLYNTIFVIAEKSYNDWEQQFNIFYKFIKDRDLKALIQSKDRELCYEKFAKELYDWWEEEIFNLVNYVWSHQDIFFIWIRFNNGLFAVWAEYRTLLYDNWSDASKRKFFWDFLKKLVSDKDFITSLWNSSSFTISDMNENIGTISNIIVELSQRSQERDIDLSDYVTKDYIDDIYTYMKKNDLAYYMFARKLYSLSIAEGNSGYDKFESYAKYKWDTNAISIKIKSISIDPKQKWKGSQYLYQYYLQALKKFVDKYKFDDRLQLLFVDITNKDLIQQCHGTVWFLLQDLANCSDDDKMKLIESLFTEDMIKKMLFANLVRMWRTRDEKPEIKLNSDLYPIWLWKKHITKDNDYTLFSVRNWWGLVQSLANQEEYDTICNQIQQLLWWS
jgi:hypothetical protein